MTAHFQIVEKTFEIKKIAAKKTLERVAQNLIFVAKPYERDEIVIDPFIYPEGNAKQLEVDQRENDGSEYNDSENNDISIEVSETNPETNLRVNYVPN